jgi:lipopolysaccharide exporter
MSMRTSVLRGTKWTGIALLVTTGCLFGQFAFLARVLPGTEMGVATLILLVTGFSELIIDVGLSSAIIQRRQVSRLQLSSVYLVNILAGLVFCIAMFLGAPLISSFFRSDDLTAPLQLVAFVFLVAPFGQIYKALLEKSLSFKSVTVSEMSGVLAGTAVACASAIAGVGPVCVVFGLYATTIVRVFGMVICGRDLFRPRLEFSLSEVRGFLSFGIFQCADGLLNYAGANAGSFVIGRILSPVSVAGYNLAFTLAVTMPGKINPVMTRVMFPAFSSMQDERETLGSNFVRLTFIAGLVSAPILTGVFLNSEAIVALFYGDSWSWIAPTLGLLCVAGIGRASSNPMGILLLTLGKMKLGFYINALKTAVTVALVALGATLEGAIGVALAMITMQLVSIGINAWLVRRLVSVAWKDYLAAIVTPVLVCIPSSLVLWLLQAILVVPVVPELVVQAAASIIVLAGTIALWPGQRMSDLRSIIRIGERTI